VNSIKKHSLKHDLQDTALAYSADELQAIIDGEFFDDSKEADMELIDLAARRLADLKGIACSEQFSSIAYEALRKWFESEK